MADRSRQSATTHKAIDNAPPPPYSDADYDSDSDSDNEPEQPQKIVINAGINAKGCNNLIPSSPNVLADATKLGSLLAVAITQLNNAAANAATDGQKRPLRVDLTINCGVTIVGNRNVVGNFGLRPKAPLPTSNGSIGHEMVLGAQGAVAGAKRRADNDDNNDAQPAAKRAATASSSSDEEI